MNNSNLITEAKGRFAETLVSTLLEHAGYRVLRLGVEETVSEIKASFVRGELPLRLPQQLHLAPDFLVIDPTDGRALLVEVKFRRQFDDTVRRELYASLRAQVGFWPGTVFVIVSPDAAGSDRRDIREYVRCLPGDYLERLVEAAPDKPHWELLRNLGGLFPRVLERDSFYNDAADLVAPIKAWGNAASTA